MPLFTPSTLSWSSAIGQIADSAGASGDAEMRTRALNSLRAAFQFLNSKKWEFTFTEADPIQVFAPFTITGGTITASGGAASAAAPAGHGIKPDDAVVGRGLILGARVSATAVSGFGFNTTISGFTGTATGSDYTFSRDLYDLPVNWKVGYTVRLLQSQRSLQLVRRRVYDRIVTDENSFSTPEAYDISMIGGKGKVRLIPGPGQSDVLQLRYYRRMYLGTATGDTTNLDIPEDYELTPIAWAKWHFLTDKGDGRAEQAQTWVALAKEGLTTMLADQTQIPDEGLRIIPGAYSGAWFDGDRSTRWLNWDYV